jgi:carboxyl-terminal processing protease
MIGVFYLCVRPESASIDGMEEQERNGRTDTKHRFVKRLAVSMLIVAIAASSFFVGQATVAGKRSVVISDPKQVLNGDFGIFWEAVDLLKQKYVGIKEVTDQDIIYSAIRGATEATGDPYTLFFDPPDSQKFQEDIQGNFGGIGAEIGEKDGQIVIIAPLAGNPAEKAGLKAGDAVLQIDDVDTAGKSVDEAVQLIRGEIGTTVRLRIMREGWTEPKEFPIVRANIILPTLDSEMKPGNIAYLKLHNFNANVPSLFYSAIVNLLSQGARGVIIDLRDNPGGFLEVAQDVAGWFLEKGEVILVERFQDGSEERLWANGNAALAELPVVILVNGGSASASEILAGALRDDRNVKLVGETTFGKGSVQEVLDLSDGSSLKVTVAEWFTPKGSKINATGLTPDVEVPLTEGDTAKGKDPQLARALSIVADEMSATNSPLYILTIQ